MKENSGEWNRQDLGIRWGCYNPQKLVAFLPTKVVKKILIHIWDTQGASMKAKTNDQIFIEHLPASYSDTKSSFVPKHRVHFRWCSLETLTDQNTQFILLALPQGSSDTVYTACLLCKNFTYIIFLNFSILQMRKSRRWGFGQIARGCMESSRTGI